EWMAGGVQERERRAREGDDAASIGTVVGGGLAQSVDQLGDALVAAGAGRGQSELARRRVPARATSREQAHGDDRARLRLVALATPAMGFRLDEPKRPEDLALGAAPSASIGALDCGREVVAFERLLRRP